MDKDYMKSVFETAFCAAFSSMSDEDIDVFVMTPFRDMRDDQS